MRKVVREAEFCKECGNVKNHEVREYFCDFCEEQIDTINSSEHNMLDITVFNKNVDIEPYDLFFCSWKCLLNKIKTLKCDSFISLPYLMYDHNHYRKGIMEKDFFDLFENKGE